MTRRRRLARTTGLAALAMVSLAELAARAPVGEPVAQVVVGALRAIRLELPDAQGRPRRVRVGLEYEANLATAEHTYYTVERRRFGRDAAVVAGRCRGDAPCTRGFAADLCRRGWANAAIHEAMFRRLHYAWIVAGATFVILLVGAAIRATPGVLIVPLEHDLGWSPAIISLAISLNLVLYGLAGPFCAAIAERLGLRRVIALAMIVLAGAILLATQIREPWHLVVLWGLVVGLGTGMTANVLGAVVATRWFVHRRGLVLGALTAATATGQLLFLPILARIVSGPGWRWALVLVGGAALLMVPIALLWIREHPTDLGLRPYGAAPDDPPPPRRVGNPIAIAFQVLGRAARTRDFWLLAGTFFVCGASTNGLIGTHFISACVDHGIPEVTAAGMLATMGIFDLFGTTGSGWLSDRIDSRWLLFTYYGLRGLSLIFLPRALLEQQGLSIFTVFYGLDWIATVPPTVKLSTDAFGARDAPIVFGWVVAAHQVGAGAAALGAGILRTQLGDYRYAFVSSGVLCLLAAGLALGIARGAARPQPAAVPAR